MKWVPEFPHAPAHAGALTRPQLFHDTLSIAS